MPVTVAIDAMGGDFGPSVTVPAALAFLDACPGARVILVGIEAELTPALAGARAGKGWGQFGFDADEDHARAGAGIEKRQRRGHGDGRTEVASHGVDRDRDGHRASGQRALPAARRPTATRGDAARLRSSAKG